MKEKQKTYFKYDLSHENCRYEKQQLGFCNFHLFLVLSGIGSERRSRRSSLSNYSVSNYSVLLNEFCCTSNDPLNSTIIQEEKPSKKKSGFATTVATFFSSKKKDEEHSLTPNSTSQRRRNRSRSQSESSVERPTIK